MSLRDISFDAGGLQYEDHRRRLGSMPLQDFLPKAIEIVEAQRTSAMVEPVAPPDTTEDFEHLRWFPYPAEAGST